jgi:hypothetical protein
MSSRKAMSSLYSPSTSNPLRGRRRGTDHLDADLAKSSTSTYRVTKRRGKPKDLDSSCTKTSGRLFWRWTI